MSVKSKGRALGRRIRRATGLPLPTCMQLGRKVAQGVWAGELVRLFQPYMTSITQPCGEPQCCIITTYKLTGPKGEIRADYSFGEKEILES